MLNPTTALWLTTAIFAITYAGLALGRWPGLAIDRSGIALVGATAMLVAGVISFDDAVGRQSIDYKTLALLLGMMIVIGFLRLSGCFEHLARFALDRIRSPRALLAAVIGISGVLSAFLINDIVCISMTPLVLHLARRLRIDPVPHLMGLATAANIGSTGTITGNPQNIFIGSQSGISYARFALRLLPVAAAGLLVAYVVVALVYRKRLRADAAPADQNPTARFHHILAPDPDIWSNEPQSASNNRLQLKSVAVALAAIVLFFVGLPLELVALGAAAVLMLGKTPPAKVYRQVDWSLLVLFAGLFVVVHAFQVRVVSTWHVERWDWLLSRPVDVLSAVSAVLSNLVSNVPAVLLMQPVVQAMPAESRETAWLALAMSSTLAGNLTILGSIANLIVVEGAAREGTRISFLEYCKAGVPLTILTLLVGVAWLQLVPY
jgi:Na+/H+ antiporter NhaD/arsenite permease-like protein